MKKDLKIMTDRSIWENAQKGEINHHSDSFDLNEKNFNHYLHVYAKVFGLVQPEFNFDINGKSIMEIGPGVFSAMLYCKNINKPCYVVEPLQMPANVIEQYADKPITFLNGTVEELDLPSVDEVWVFNVMQHIWQPDVFVEKLKRAAKKIVFFEPINTPKDQMHIQTYGIDSFKEFFGDDTVKLYQGGSIPNFHTADCAYGIWDYTKEKTLPKNISIVGIGKLGLCFALSLEKNGFNVMGVDIVKEYVDKINSKEYTTTEPDVDNYLFNSKRFRATTDLEAATKHSDILFVVVATPSLPDGGYDHSQVDAVVEKLISYGKQENEKHLVITCTVMPGYCDSIQSKLESFGWSVSYNPEFIAQGTVIQNQENPDMVLIGEANSLVGDLLENIYKKMCRNSPKFNRMSRLSAEITKIALNCFLVTKIAFANMVGDAAVSSGGEFQKILEAIGSDKRIGNKFLGYGYGFGGPCLPRDARAFAKFASDFNCYSDIPIAADVSNKKHLDKQVEMFVKANEKTTPVVFDTITYKKESELLVESQQLEFAKRLAEAGYTVTVFERDNIISELKAKYKDLFLYEKKKSDTRKKVISFSVFGASPIYTIGAIENARLAKKHYPDWECRFYLDQIASKEIKQQLLDLDCVVVEKERHASYDGLFWRFEPSEDPKVDVWISRDADSRLSAREAKAVEEWLSSGKTFHIMRDSHNHDLYQIMAGMFGVRNDLLRKNRTSINFQHNGFCHVRDSDQLVLNNIWHYAEHDHFCHDHWANSSVNDDVKLTTMNGRDPYMIYQGQGTINHVSSRRKNYPNQFSERSINKGFPETERPEFGLYIGQRIHENNTPIWNEEVQWEYELRGIQW